MKKKKSSTDSMGPGKAESSALETVFKSSRIGLWRRFGTTSAHTSDRCSRISTQASKINLYHQSVIKQHKQPQERQTTYGPVNTILKSRRDKSLQEKVKIKTPTNPKTVVFTTWQPISCLRRNSKRRLIQSWSSTALRIMRVSHDTILTRKLAVKCHQKRLFLKKVSSQTPLEMNSIISPCLIINP